MRKEKKSNTSVVDSQRKEPFLGKKRKEENIFKYEKNKDGTN
jgi:hypothetical protein